MINQHTYVIAVPNLAVSSAFYRDALGFEIREFSPGWLMYVQDGCRIMAGECPDAPPATEIADHSYFAYLTVDDAQAYYDRVQRYDGEILKPLRDEPWGMREFALRTADGHRIMIGQDLDTAA